ncbi:MAG: hypothetical protein C0401_11225 [Anaerolinea sp.]|nr:hypothetical protein [Anaerolinea sp.]
MKCYEVNQLLIAYLDNEVTPSERTLIRSHLAGCDICQEKLAEQSALQSRVSQFLKIRAAQAVPSPQAWSRLQARLTGEAYPSSSWLPIWLQRPAQGVGRINRVFEGGISMKKRFALTTIAVLVMSLSVMAFVPSVRAQASAILNAWFSIKVSNGEMGGSMPQKFTPLRPTYVPAEFMSSGFAGGTDGSGTEFFGLEFYNDNTEQFVAFYETKALSDKPLPTGQEATINGQLAVLETDVEGTFGLELHAYTDGKRLTWYVGDVKVELLSNLPVEEMLKVAESLVTVEAGEGEMPRPPSAP